MNFLQNDQNPSAKGDPSANGSLTARVSELRIKYRKCSTAELLRGIVEVEFPNRVAVASSFGAESAPLLSMVATVSPRVQVLFVHTGMLFDETVNYARDLCAKLRLTNLIIIESAADSI